LKFKSLLVALVFSVPLSGCLIPEKFTASIAVKPDGAYAYRYEGTAVHFLAAVSIKEKGSLAEREEIGLRQEADKAAKTPGIKKIVYVGNGRYNVAIDQELKVGQQASVLPLFGMTQDNDGVYVISSPAMKAKDVEQLKALNIKVIGEAKVTLPSNAKVIKHNADSTPGFFGNAYSWKIGSIEDQPAIRFTLSR
jgi:hypothetical protein